MANSVMIFERKNKSKNFNSLENFHIFGNLPKKIDSFAKEIWDFTENVLLLLNGKLLDKPICFR